MSLARVAAVTGANSGIGFEAARLLAGEGYSKIILICRSEERAADAVAQLRKVTGKSDVFSVQLCDLANMESARAAATQLLDLGQKIDVLLLNAGANFSNYSSKTSEGVEPMMAANLLGHHILTMTLINGRGLAKDSQVIIAGSGGATYEVMLTRLVYEDVIAHESFGGDIDRVMDAIVKNDIVWADFGIADGASVYANTKVWCAWWAKSMSKRHDSAKFICVDPGWVPNSRLLRDFDLFTRISSSVIAAVGPCLGMSHSATVAAQRYMTALNFPDSENGAFWVSPEGKWSGQMKASTKERLPWIHDEKLQEHSFAAVTRATRHVL